MNTTEVKLARPTIALLDDYYSRAEHYADWGAATFANFRFITENIAVETELVNRLKDVQAVGLMRERTPFPASLIQQLPELKLIVTSGKKNAAIDTAAAAAQGITVCGTESPGHATAELALLLILSLSRQLVPLVNALQQQNQWQPAMGRDMRGQTLGIVGLGRLGGQLAGFAQALGMHVIAWSENLTDDRCSELGVKRVSRAELFAEADTVSIHLRHSTRTHHLIHFDDLQRLGPNGYLVNTSRAEIVDPVALKQALDNNCIAGAASDVFEKEPADHNQWMVTHPKVLATPHIGYCTDETFRVFYGQMLDAFSAYFADAPIRVIASPN